MSFFAISDAELNLGITYAQRRFETTITARNLLLVSDHLLMLRQTQLLEFPDALRETLDHFKLEGDRRDMYSATIGKIFSSRAASMHKGRTKKIPRKRNQIPIVCEGAQFAFAAMREDPRKLKENRNGRQR